MASFCVDPENKITISNAPFLELAILMPILLIILLTMLSITLYNEYTKRNDPTFTKVTKKLRIPYIALQLIALYWLIIDFIRLTIDPLTSTPQQQANSIGCDLMAWSPKILPLIYYFTYLYQVLLRLELSFKGSFLAFNKRTIFILSLCIFVPLGLLPPFFFIANKNQSTCIGHWKPMDFSSMHKENNPLTYCGLEISSIGNIILILGVLLVTTANIVFGLMFSIRLKKLLSMNKGNKNISFKFKGLIIKNSILTLCGTISTVLSYMIWIALAMSGHGVGASLLYADLIVNCVVIGLMFNYNDKAYKKLCSYCIRLCLTTLDQSAHKMKESDVSGYIKGEIDLSDVNFSSIATNKTSAMKSIGNAFKRMTSRSSKMEAKINVVIDINDTSQQNGNAYDDGMMTPPPPQNGIIVTDDDNENDNEQTEMKLMSMEISNQKDNDDGDKPQSTMLYTNASTQL
eukprot:333042_1